MLRASDIAAGKLRRIYDITNILCSLGLLVKVLLRTFLRFPSYFQRSDGAVGTVFQWHGVDVQDLMPVFREAADAAHAAKPRAARCETQSSSKPASRKQSLLPIDGLDCLGDERVCDTHLCNAATRTCASSLTFCVQGQAPQDGDDSAPPSQL